MAISAPSLASGSAKRVDLMRVSQIGNAFAKSSQVSSAHTIGRSQIIRSLAEYGSVAAVAAAAAAAGTLSRRHRGVRRLATIVMSPPHINLAFVLVFKCVLVRAMDLSSKTPISRLSHLMVYVLLMSPGRLMVSEDRRTRADGPRGKSRGDSDVEN